MGLLGAGIELDGDQRQWHLAKAREWFDQQPSLLPAGQGTVLQARRTEGNRLHPLGGPGAYTPTPQLTSCTQ